MDCCFIFIISCAYFCINFFNEKLEVVENYFVPYAEVASKDGIFHRGWMPGWLPKSAYNIRDAHDIDSNESFLIFGFSKEDEFYLKCQEIPRETIPMPDRKNLIQFPGYVFEALDQIKRSPELLIYTCNNEMDRILTVDKNKGVAYVWRVAQ